ncbi:MAG: hypothetical protein COB02_13640 [Candidatus Cloacimonadota bacterium]|nr:MAG: hypothetical protein COB02_13640 [Candidatus Cloacimonadota bacterium]
MIQNNINPYLISPLEFGFGYTMVEDRKFFGDYLYHYSLKTGFPTLTAIYPPVIIYLFSFIKSPIQLTLFYLLLETILILLLCLYINKLSKNKSKNYKLLYLWYLHPLVLYEGYLNKHYDLLIGLFILASIVFYNDFKNKIHTLFFALAIHFKGYAIIYLPFFKKSRWNILLLWSFIEILSYLWYPSRFLKKSSINTFINQWEFNNGLFTTLRIYLETIYPFEQSLLYTRYIFLTLFFILFFISFYYWYKNKIDQFIFLLITLIFFICSPVANPWYFLMSVPFFINYSNNYKHHFFLSILSFYYLFYISYDPLNSLLIISFISWFILSISFFSKNIKRLNPLVH